MHDINTWQSTTWGQRFTNTLPWVLTLDGEEITFGVAGKLNKFSITSIQTLKIHEGIIWRQFDTHRLGARTRGRNSLQEYNK